MLTLNTNHWEVVIALLYFGLLHANDVKNLDAKESVLSEESRKNDHGHFQSSKKKMQQRFWALFTLGYFTMFKCYFGEMWKLTISICKLQF